MNADTSSSELVLLVYHLLKKYFYYDKMDLFLRANVAAYKAPDAFQKQQDNLMVIVDGFQKGVRKIGNDITGSKLIKCLLFEKGRKALKFTGRRINHPDSFFPPANCLISLFVNDNGFLDFFVG